MRLLNGVACELNTGEECEGTVKNNGFYNKVAFGLSLKTTTLTLERLKGNIRALQTPAHSAEHS